MKVPFLDLKVQYESIRSEVMKAPAKHMAQNIKDGVRVPWETLVVSVSIPAKTLELMGKLALL